MSPAAQEHHRTGIDFCRQGRFEEAIACFKAAIRAAPEAAEHHQWLVSAMLAWARQHPEAPAAEDAPSPALPLFSAVVCSINPEKFIRLERNLKAMLPADRLEIIRIADARSMSEGYNRGASRAAGEILLFCHDDIRILTRNAARTLAAAMERFDLLGVAGSTWLRDPKWTLAGQPYLRGQVVHALPDRPGFTYSAYGVDGAEAGNIQALDGLFLVLRRDFWTEHPFDEGYEGFHLYDIDLSFRCHLAGRRVGVCNDILIEHGSLGRYDAAWRRAAEYFTARFGDRLERHPAGMAVCSNFRLNDPEQVQQLFRALRCFGYGTEVAAPGAG